MGLGDAVLPTADEAAADVFADLSQMNAFWGLDCDSKG
jgi:hypothetical protein